MKRLPKFVFLCALFFSPFFAQADSLILGGADFLPLDYQVDYRTSYFYTYLNYQSVGSEFTAPIHLPDGARITSVVIFYDDSHAIGDLQVSMYKVNIYNNNDTVMAAWSSTGTPGYTTHKIAPITGGNSINNTGYAYFAFLHFTSNLASVDVKMYKIKINYAL